MSRERRERFPEQDASRFIDLVSGGGFWQSVDLRVCAIRSGRRWMNLVTRGFLDHRPPRSVPRFSPVERHQFRAWQVVRPVSDLPAIVRGIADGMMRLRPRYVGYVGQSSQAATDIRYSFNELAGSYRCVDRVSVPLASTTSNTRIKAQDAIDPGLARFRKQLRASGKDKSQQFEAAVGLLFFFLGFDVHPLSGHTRRGDTVDHLAHAPGSPVMLAIECTVGSLDSGGKVGKLIARREDVRSQLPDREVIAVLATASARAALSKAEVEKAEGDDVVLLAQEELQDLWIAVQTGETSVHVVHRFRRQLSQVRFRRTKNPSSDSTGAVLAVAQSSSKF